MRTTVISLKLTETELRTLDQVVKENFFGSRSSALRSAMGLLFDNNKVSSETDRQIEIERMKSKPRYRRVTWSGKTNAKPGTAPMAQEKVLPLVVFTRSKGKPKPKPKKKGKRHAAK